jgi:uncharacterized protein YraI
VSRNIKLAMLVSVAVLATPAMAWESANDGGRLRYFTNTIDLNMRAWPAPWSQIVATLPHGSQMPADRCIHPEGLQDDWCHVMSDSSTGWVDAAYLQETGRGKASVYHVSSTDGVLNLRTGPSVNNAIVIPMPTGAIVQVGRCIAPSPGSTAPWCETTYNGYHGWASTAGMYPDNNSSPFEGPEAKAERQAAEAKARREVLDAQAAADAAAAARANAKAARLAAEAKEKKEALDAQAAADAVDAKAKLAAEAKAVADAKAKQDAEDARLEAEAEQAKQWRVKVDEARMKGTNYTDAGGSKWSLSEADNPMIDDKDYSVTSVQLNGQGAVANIEGTCRRPGQVTFVATLGEVEDPNNPLGLPDFASGYVAGNKRINDDAAFPTRFQSQKFRNTVLLATLTSQHTADSIETTWRVLAEVETARGRLIMKIPTFDANVQKLLVACGKQYENAKKRGGLLDAPTYTQ